MTPTPIEGALAGCGCFLIAGAFLIFTWLIVFRK